MGYPQRVEYYGGFPEYDLITSERYYVTHEVDTTTIREIEYSPDDRDRELRKIYQDEETGIMTADVPAFEAWIKRVQLAPVPPTAEDE